MSVIAIDGPSGSGKSTLARRLAAQRGMAYLDTGAMYRALTLWCLEGGVDLAAGGAVAEAAGRAPLVMGTDPANPVVLLDGVDVSERIREADVSLAVSAVATNLAVRAILRDWQRQLIGEAASPGIVAEGRDITTVVAPDADVRILLIADATARLHRRAAERHGVSGEQEIAATEEEVLRRDRDDSTVSQFMQAAPGVLTLDNSNLTPDETFRAAQELIERHLA